jgi:DNA polymerase-1
MSADASMAGQAENARRLVLVDGHAYAYRAFHAIRSLSSPQGEPTNAIFGFIKMVERLLELWKPSHLAVVWDGGLAAERVAELPGYKAQRPPMPETLGRQIESIEEWLKASAIRSLCQAGVEADDWIGTLARGLSVQIGQVLIASSDKDFMQLVDDRIGLVNPSESAARIWTVEDVKAKTGVRPEQVVDWLSLVGDAVDNIEGVSGIGPKRAAELLRIFGSVDGIFENLERVENARMREKLRISQSVVRRNQRLIGLKDAGEHARASELQMGVRDCAALGKLYERWGFRSLLDGLMRPEWRQGDLFGQTA